MARFLQAPTAISLVHPLGDGRLLCYTRSATTTPLNYLSLKHIDGEKRHLVFLTHHATMLYVKPFSIVKFHLVKFIGIYSHFLTLVGRLTSITNRLVVKVKYISDR